MYEVIHSQQNYRVQKPNGHVQPRLVPSGYNSSSQCEPTHEHILQISDYNYFLQISDPRLLVHFSPRMRRAKARSFGMIVTRFACKAHKLQSSNKFTMYASEASWSASRAWDWNFKSF